MNPNKAEQIVEEVSKLADKIGQKEGVYKVFKKGLNSQVKLSAVIPYMQIDKEKKGVLWETLVTGEGLDEIVVVPNWRYGYAKPINRGLEKATGDYMLVMNDDLQWDYQSLKRLCRPDTVTSPKVNGRGQEYWGCSFCVPRDVYEQIGGMYEGYDISYYDDNDFWETLKKNKIPMECVEEVEVSTQGGRTLDRFPDRDKFFEKNKQHFIKRWGFDPTGTQQYT